MTPQQILVNLVMGILGGLMLGFGIGVKLATWLYTREQKKKGVTSDDH